MAAELPTSQLIFPSLSLSGAELGGRELTHTFLQTCKIFSFSTYMYMYSIIIMPYMLVL